MIRLTRLADYAIMLLTLFARQSASQLTANELSVQSKLPLPTVNKILKILTRDGLLLSHRGARGGYLLSRSPEDITLADIVAAIEGPVSMTECCSDTNEQGGCDHEWVCPTRGNWQKINQSIHVALEKISLAEMAKPLDGRHPHLSTLEKQEITL